MLTITEKIPDFDTFEDYLGYRRESALFFDIETTGLSAASAIVFLIGTVKRCGGSWQLTQWLAQRPEDEPLLLQAFFDAAAGCDTLIHFNGTTFDLPFVRERTRLFDRTEIQHSGGSCGPEMPPARHPMDDRYSLDLYRKFRPLKQPLGLPRMNQTTLEQFLGWPREDRLSGKQMISLFQKYAVSGEPRLADLLLLHNHDDLLGMTSLLRLCAYSMLFEGQFAAVHASVANHDPGPDIECGTGIRAKTPMKENTDPGNSTHPCMRLHLTLETALPRDITLSIPCAFPMGCADLSCTLTASGAQAILSVPGFRGELRHFFPNYRDYYYLPLEDQAIHKSVAAFVDPQCRTRATAASCYIKKSGLFFPQPEEFFSPAFKASCDSGELFFACQEQADPALPDQLSERHRDPVSETQFRPEAARSLSLDQEKLSAYAASLLRRF